MPIDIQLPADQVDPLAADYAPVLKKLQANIMKPHGRNFARHIFVKFTGTRDVVTKWIREWMGPLVAKRSQWDEYNSPPEEEDAGPVYGFFLSANQYLGLKTDSFKSEAFRRGMKAQTDGLLDRLFDRLLDRRNDDPPPAAWEPGFREQQIHALITIAADGKAAPDDATIVEDLAKEVRKALEGVAVVLATEQGNVLRRKRPGKPPHSGDPVEHFGYRDGISQPIFSKPDLGKAVAKAKSNVKWDPGAPLSLVLTQDPMLKDPDALGSYLVYRKLAQDLDGFERAIQTAAQSLGVSPDLAGAMVVGRFKDGSPIVLDSKPTGDAANDFNFRQDDREGGKCPFHAHIRKVNPRGTTPAMSPEKERTRRIARRGIPYGPPVGPHVADFPAPNPDPSVARGLLFLCFQADIDEQFEFIQRTWVDNSLFPKGILFQRNTGDDPLIGQDKDEAQRWPKKWGDPDAGKKTFNFESAVTLKGGEYFFAPSLPFLQTIGA